MKNLYILPTNKPSRLVKIYNDVNRETFTLKLDVEVNDSFKEYVNIYITSDEEIKEGEYQLYNPLGNFDNAKVSKAERLLQNDSRRKKIILTTNQDLIKEGVQEINDEFLEWFVENPSCKRVRVDKFVSGKYFCTNPIISKKETKPKTMLESLQDYFKKWKQI